MCFYIVVLIITYVIVLIFFFFQIYFRWTNYRMIAIIHLWYYFDIMSSHSGTIGRSRGLSAGSQIRRPRSIEWNNEQSTGYSSSEDDENNGRGSINPSFDSQLLAQLIAQSQQLSSNYSKFYFVSYKCS